MSRSVNMAIIIGNLTRDPEMRYTPQGHAVTSFGVATNRSWVSDGERKEEVEFHNVVAWNKLAELCQQLLAKGRRVYIQGRLQTRSWEGSDGMKRSKTEIVADNMVILDSKYKQFEGGPQFSPAPQDKGQGAEEPPKTDKSILKSEEGSPEESQEKEVKESEEEIKVEDIPF